MLQYIARVYGGSDRTACGLAWRGCKDVPSAEVFFARLGGNHALTQSVNHMAALTYETTGHVQVGVTDLVPRMVHDFFWQPSEHKEAMCKMMTALVNALISTGTSVVSMLVPLALPFKAAAPVAVAAGSVASSIATEGVTAAATKTAPIYASAGFKIFVRDVGWSATTNFGGVFINANVGKTCFGRWPSARDLRMDNMADLTEMVHTTSSRYRQELSSSMRVLNSPEAADVDPDGNTDFLRLLASPWNSPVSARARRSFAKDPYQLEAALEQRILEGLIVECMRAGHCHLKCWTAAGPDDCDHNPLVVERFKYCPEPGTVCQLDCWQQANQKGRNVAPYGEGKMSQRPWNINLQEVIQASWHNYKATRNGAALSPSLDSCLRPGMSIAGDPRESKGTQQNPAYNLPVCASPRKQTRNWESPDKKQRDQFPCMCGSILSEETSQVHMAMGMNYNDYWKLHEDRCVHFFEETVQRRPLEHYLGLCGLESRWPLRGDRIRLVQRGADPRCQLVLDKAMARMQDGADGRELNRWFCEESKEYRILEWVEKSWVYKPHWKGHRDRCIWFMNDYRKGKAAQW